MLDLEDRYKTLLKKDYFKDHPLLKSLFSDISSCLNQVDDLKLSKIRVVPTTPEDEKILLSEIENAPKAVQKLCQSKNELALSIVFYNYGVAKGKFPFPVKKSRFSKIRCIVLVLFLIIKISMSMFINRQKPIESRKALIQNIHEPTKYCQYICA